MSELIAFIGVGNMGNPMAQNLIKAGKKVRVFDISKKMIELAKEKKLDVVENLDTLITECDLLVGGVLIPGAEAPKLVTKNMLKNMKRGSVIVDVAIDQGGCVETSKPTTFAEPTYIVDDVVHYCVANMPGGVPRTSTLALNKATLPFLSKLAKDGYKKALKNDPNFLAGLNVHKGNVTYKAVAETFGHKFVSPNDVVR